MSILLASQSPRRRELLAAAGVSFETFSPSIDETPGRGELPRVLVRRLARQKAETAKDRAAIVIAADTVVALGAHVLNKPEDDADAARMLRSLSGKWHHVFTGCCVINRGRVRSIVVGTAVQFRKLSKADIARYVDCGEGRDKAGAYAIQGVGSALIDRVRGSYTNVIGLPVPEVLELLR